MTSLAIIIYLVARTIPRIDENIALGQPRKSFLENVFSRLPLEKVDLMFNNSLEKLLRKFKIVVMKIDNILTRRLSGFKPMASSEKDSRPNIFSSSGGHSFGGENHNSGGEEIK